MDSAPLTPGTVAPAHVTPATPAPILHRLDSVDLLRGIVMVLMALDHTRDYLHFGELHGFNPLDLKTTTVPLFLTRWITHFCAPTFVFLAGTGAFLAGTRGRSKRDLSWFLVSRGAWLILLELTFIHWAGWAFAVNLHFNLAMVIWAIGWSMIALAALIHVPLRAVATIGIIMIVGHNALDGLRPENLGAVGWLWKVLHVQSGIEFAPGYFLFVAYPLVPWIGVMAAGYAFGQILLQPRTERRRLVFRLGAALTLAFVLLRVSNLYGDPKPWTTQANPVFTVLSILDCYKYPPSLCYLLMTLGPGLMLLSALDRETLPAPLRPVLVFGRVPLFYYLLHIPLIHALALLIEKVRIGHAEWLFGDPFGPAHGEPAAAAGIGLVGVYAVWILAIVLLYPLCRWFAALKRRRRDAWLSYL
jgi:uncharacterized membrane protein